MLLSAEELKYASDILYLVLVKIICRNILPSEVSVHVSEHFPRNFEEPVEAEGQEDKALSSESKVLVEALLLLICDDSSLDPVSVCVFGFKHNGEAVSQRTFVIWLC